MTMRKGRDEDEMTPEKVMAATTATRGTKTKEMIKKQECKQRETGQVRQRTRPQFGVAAWRNNGEV